jgi:hypothetical protein
MRDETRPVEDEMVKWAMSDVAPMSDEAFARGRTALLARMDDAGKVVPLAPRRRRRIPVLAAAAAMVAIAGAALLLPSMTSRDSGPNVAAAALLNQAAGLTGDAKLRPGEYLYVLQYARWSSRNYDHTWMYLQDQQLQTWIPADRGGTWLHRRNKVGDKQWLIGQAPADPADLTVEIEGEWRSEGGRWPDSVKIPVSFRDPTPEYIAALPRDPSALYEKLRTEVAGDEGQNLLRMVSQGLDTGMYPADVRSAIFQALTHLPKLEVADQTAVVDSRRGTALGVTEGETTEQIVIDRDSGTYLGSRTVMAQDSHGLKKGQVIGVTSLTTKVVSGLGQTS